MAHSANVDISFSRPASSLLGKQNSVLKTMVSDEVADDFVRFARERGYAATSEALRDVVLVALYGQEHLVDLHRQRITSLGQKRAAIGPDATELASDVLTEIVRPVV